MPPPRASAYRFGPYELRLRTRQLYRGDIKLKLRPQPLQVLEVLLARPDGVVTREELRRLLWDSATFVDFEQGLNTAVKELRAALCDSADSPEYIETVPKLGYRIIVPVEAEPLTEASQAQPETKGEPAEVIPAVAPAEQPAGSARISLRWPAIAGAVAALLLSVSAFWWWSHRRAEAQPVNGKLMLAVLPFENLTGDSSQDYFSDGLTEEMIAQLSPLNPAHMGVIARTSVMHYKNSQEPLDQIGRELGVQYVLEGSVRRDDERVRVTAQLIRVQDQTHVWSRQYARQLSDMLALQSEVALEIADEIQLALGDTRKLDTASRAIQTPRSYAAYDLYSQGLYFWNQRSYEGFQRAVGLFQQAIDKDPNYARAYAGLAETYALMPGFSTRSIDNQMMPRARAAALRALELDEKSAEAHTALALIIENYDYDLQAAEKEYRRAIELDPNYATAHQWYAELLTWQGNFDEALRESERARELDPLSLIIATDRGATLYFSRNYSAAIDQLSAVQALDPRFGRAGIILYSYIHERRFNDARSLLGPEPDSHETKPWILRQFACLEARAGNIEKARELMDRLDQLHPGYDPAYLAPIFVSFDKARALALLQEAYVQRSHIMITIKVDPDFDELRSDPRFQKILQEVGFTQ
jgi:TolB-like protein/DNA-binding winged helix-turn-helix (wHTH) protein/Tfp pilus assembly protein PilF